MQAINILAVVGLMIVSGCAVHNVGFECGIDGGQRCVSVSKVNKMIDQGLISDEEAKPIKAEAARVKRSKQPKRRNSKKDLDIWFANDNKGKG